MALVTVQRSPSPSASAETDEVDAGPETENSSLKSPRNRRRRKSRSALKKLKKLFNTVRFVTKLKPCFSESYFTVKGAALILPQSDYEAAYTRKTSKGHGGDIQSHLQSMFSLLRPLDTIKVAVKLEGPYDRYLALVSCLGKQDTEESVILGMDLRGNTATVGLIMPVWAHTHIQLDGDGGFSITSNKEIRFFKPVSVQAMWSALQSLNKVVKIANDNLYIPGGLTHTWIGFYDAKISKDIQVVTEWNSTADIDRTYRTDPQMDTCDEESVYKRIKTELKIVMMAVDLEDVTCKFLRESVEKQLGMNLKEYRHFIDTEMFEIMGQMDSPTKIQDYLYLGSEWNASNIEELQNNGVHYILNVSREIDNFYPGILHYMNVREWDVETSDLLKYWEDTHRYIDRARKKNGKVLVHCKMGISRSASTVIAFLMKEMKMSREEAFEFTKQKRSIINPNNGFWKQLETYEGILTARRNWENFDKPPAGDLVPLQESEEGQDPDTAFPKTAEDLMALKLGKDSGDFGNYPFVHTEPDIEMSSRSADSTEESLPDERSPQPAEGSEKGATGGAFIYPKGKKSKSSSGDYLETDSSDNTDSEVLTDSDVDEANSFRPIDVPAIDIQGVAIEKSHHKRNHKKVKVDAHRSKSESDKSSLTVETKLAGMSREGSMSKFRPDESWIKLAQSDEEGQVAEVMDTGQDLEEGLWMGEREKTSEKSEMISDDQNTIELSKAKEQEHGSTETKAMETDVSESGRTSAMVDTSVDRGSVETGDQGQDTRENLTLKTCVVKKQKQGLEELIKNTSTHKKTDSVGATDLQMLFQSDNVKDSESGKVSVDQEANTHKASGTTETDSCDIAIKVGSDMEVDQSNNAEPDSSEATDGDQTKMRSRPSVYDLEEIELPEDYVKKTTQEIEERLTVDTPRKKIQRSSSLKSRRVTPKAKDRDNERRKTCIAMLSPSHSNISLNDQQKSGSREVIETDQSEGEDLSARLSADTDADAGGKVDETGIVKVYKFMGEELTVQEGLVRKQTMDIEQKGFDVNVKRSSAKLDGEMEHDGFISDSASLDNMSTSEITSHREPESTELSAICKETIQGSGDKYFTGYAKDSRLKQVSTAPDKNERSKGNLVGKDLSVSPKDSRLKQVSTTLDKSESCKGNLVGKDLSVSPTLSSASKDSEITKDRDITDELVSARRVDSIKANFQEMVKTDEKSETEVGGACAAPGVFRRKGLSKQSSRFDDETLELIREIGSALMNSPARAEAEEETDTPAEGNLVRLYVKNIEHRIRGTRKKKSAREIIIVDKDSGQDSASVSSSQRSSTSTPTSVCDSRSESSVPVNPKWSPVSRKLSSPSSITSSPETVQTLKGSSAERHESACKPDPSNLSLKLEGSPKAEQSVDTDTESETCSVKNLVGKFETSSGASTPVSMLYGCIVSPSSTSALLPGATQDMEVIDKKDGNRQTGEPVISPKRETTKTVQDTAAGHCLSPKSVQAKKFHDFSSHSAFSRPSHSPGSSRKVIHRQSEPDIHLLERNIQLLDAKLRESGAGCIIESEEEDNELDHSVPSFMTRSRSEDQGHGQRECRARILGAKSKTGSLGRSETLSESDSPDTPMFTWEGKKIRKNYGKSHPLAKLEGTYRGSIRSTPFYSTM